MVIQFSHDAPAEMKAGLKNLKNVSKVVRDDKGTEEIKEVIFGGALKMLAANKEFWPAIAEASKLPGVTFEARQNTMAQLNIKTSELPRDIVVVPSGAF